MRKILLVLAIAAAIGLFYSDMASAQYAQYPIRHGVVKCYREFVIGPYRCHHFRNPLLPF